MKSFIAALAALAIVGFAGLQTCKASAGDTAFQTVKVRATQVFPSTPSALVIFQGKVDASTNIYNGAEIKGYKVDSTTNSNFQIGFLTRASTAVAFTESMTISSNTFVGINNVLPLATLDVNGQSRLGSFTSTQLQAATPTVVGAIVFDSTNNEMYLGTGTTVADSWRLLRSTESAVYIKPGL